MQQMHEVLWNLRIEQYICNVIYTEAGEKLKLTAWCKWEHSPMWICADVEGVNVPTKHLKKTCL